MKKNTQNLATTKRPLFSLQNEINSLFENFFDDRLEMAGPFYQQKWPQVEVKETDKEYQVRAEIPGLTEDDIHLRLADNALEISGERKAEKEEEKEGVYYSEMSYGNFYRTIPFEREVDSERVIAKMKDGILKVNIAKTETSKPSSRKIEISR